MKKLILLSAITCMSVTGFSQDYIWVKGNTTSGLPGVYGTMGTPALSNNPGARHGCAKWVDNNGNLWLFGGEGYSSSATLCWLNDLWKYNIITNEWTWVRGSSGPNQAGAYGTIGVPSATNNPGAREFIASWTDAAGNFWLFGGDGMDAAGTFGRLGDLWKYDPVADTWTWVSGFNTVGQSGIYGTQGTPAPANMPGCRYGAGAWTDPAGNFWLYGGRGIASTANQGYLNDLWKYTPSTNQWTWISGSNITGQLGQYGTLSVPAATNTPGARYLPQCWSDAAGSLYLMGGFGFGATAINYLNDFWKYDPAANTWTWIGGSTSPDISGVYGTQGVASNSNFPGSRRAGASWVDGSGNFWLFGGEGYDAGSSTYGALNDLFRYNPSVNQWTWMKGSTMKDQNGTYGTIGVAAPGNNPGGRTYNTWWKDAGGRFWLLGGEGFDAATGTEDNMDDLWTFSVPCNPDSITVLPGKVICSGTAPTFTAVNGGASVQWFNSPTSTLSIASGSVFSSPSLTSAASSTVYSYYAEANSCTTAPRASITITVNALPSLTTTSTHSMLCQGNSATLTVTGSNTHTWSVNQQTAAAVTITPASTTSYTVTGTTNGCSSTAVITQSVVLCGVGIAENSMNQIIGIYPNPNNGEFTLETAQIRPSSVFSLYNSLGQKVFERVLSDNKTLLKTGLDQGIYYYEVSQEGTKTQTGKLLVR